MAEWLGYFRMKVVDVNRTSRGSPTGGIGRFSALVVVGNSNVSSWASNANDEYARYSLAQHRLQDVVSMHLY